MRSIRLSLILFVLLLAASGVRPLAAAAELDASLLESLRGAGPEEMIPVQILLREQGVPPSERARLDHLPRAARRAEGRAQLEALAGRTQVELDGFLRHLRERGEARGIRSLWLVNAVACSLEARRVPDLARFPSVRKILWDPPIPVEEMLDDGGIGSGGLPASGRSSFGPTGGAMLATEISWQLTKVHAPEAWDLGYRGAGVVVGIVDTGVDYTHPDLAQHIYVNPGEIPDNGQDDDGNGFIDDVRGWDFVSEDNDPMDESSNSHGTKVAGIVAGDGASGTATGVAPEATILPIKASGGTWTDLLEGLQYAVLMDVDVIQMSVTQKWRFNPKPDFAAWRAVADNELALGICHANSIGNEGLAQDTDPIPFNIAAPGNCPSPWIHHDQYLVGGVSGIVAVGAIAETDIAADYSGRGPADWEDIAVHYPSYPYTMPPEYQDYPYSTGEGGLIKPDLCAPGPGTLSAKRGGGYEGFDGTSAAAPHVAGAMAILLQADSTLSPEQIDMILETTASDLGDPGKDNLYGAGLLDVQAGLIKALDLDFYGTVSGTVTDGGISLPLPNSDLDIAAPLIHRRSNALGGYEASLESGSYEIRTEAFGYQPDTSSVAVSAGGDVTHNVALTRLPTSTLRGRVLSLGGDTLSGVAIRLRQTPIPTVFTDAGGSYEVEEVPVGIPFTVEAARFNYLVATTEVLLSEGTADTLDLVLMEGMYDDFESDQGWTLDPTDTASMGRWERADPAGTWSGATPVQPDSDYTAAGSLCFLTQNGNVGAGPTYSDVDGGTTTLLSPVFDGTIYTQPVLSYRRWYSNNTGGTADDVFTASVSSDGGTSWTILETVAASAPAWVERTFDLESYIALTDSMRIRFVAADRFTSSTVEAAVDEVKMSPATVAAPGLRPLALVMDLQAARPSPFRGSTTILYSLARGGPTRLSVYDVQGRLVRDLARGVRPAGPQSVVWDGTDSAGHRCASGVYLYRLSQGSEIRHSRVVLIP